MHSTVIAGTGHSLPATVIPNSYFTQELGLDTSDAWIVEHTGVQTRHWANAQESTTSLATAAALQALEKAGVDKSEVDAIVVATITPDNIVPSCACELAGKLGLTALPAMDVNASCSGFLNALTVAHALMQVNKHFRHALVVGADRVSSITNMKDRNSCILFGDGAGAAVLSNVAQAGVGIADSILGGDGNSRLLCLPNKGTISMQGKSLSKQVIAAMLKSARVLMERNNLKPEDISLLLPHQSSLHLIEEVAAQLQVPLARTAVNVQRYGNTSSAAIPIALSEAVAAGRLKNGDKLLMLAAGGGLTWGATLVNWHSPVQG